MTSLRLAVSSLVLVGAVVLRADDAPTAKDTQAVRNEIMRLDCVKPLPSLRPWNNVSFSYELGLNIRTTFKGFGAPLNTFAGSNPGPATHPANHQYDDGYNKIDSTGNDHSAQQGFADTTTFWGYQNASQWNHVNNTIEMHSSHPGQVSDVSNNDPRQGFESAYERIICEHKRWYWGVEAGFGYTAIDLNENRTLIAPVITTTDAYAIPFDEVRGTNSVPAAPYNGPFNGDFGSSLLGDIPMRTVAENGQFAVLLANRHFDANVWKLRLGPKLHVPVNNRLEFAFGGGLSVGVIASHFNFSEQVVFPSSLGGGLSPTFQGSSQAGGTLFGPYLNGLVVVPLTPDSRAFAGVKWEDLGKYNHSIGTHVAQLDFTDAVSVSIGFAIGF